jgi:uncharacterized protein
MLRQPPAIEGYGGGGFRVGGDWLAGSVLILDDVARPWPVGALADLTLESLAPVLAEGMATVEFVLLGAGPATAPPPKGVRQALQAEGLGLEVMDTASACRLYNVLAQEGRRVAAALIAI